MQSEIIEFVCFHSVPTEAPSNVNISVLNSTAVHVAFTPPPQQMIPGVNLGFKVTFFYLANDFVKKRLLLTYDDDSVPLKKGGKNSTSVIVTNYGTGAI